MTEAQGWHLIGVAWLAMAAFDKPVDVGTLLYGICAIVALIASFRTGGKR